MLRNSRSVTVAQFISSALTECGKSQKEVAQEIGYEHPNIITMFKKGITKIPLTKVGALAKALAVDPVYLFKLVLREYAPETLDAIEDIFEESILTPNERKLVAAYRERTGGIDVEPVLVSDCALLAYVKR